MANPLFLEVVVLEGISMGVILEVTLNRHQEVFHHHHQEGEEGEEGEELVLVLVQGKQI